MWDVSFYYTLPFLSFVDLENDNQLLQKVVPQIT